MTTIISWICFCALFSTIFAGQHLKKDGFQKTLGHLRPRTPPEVQENAVKDLIGRLLGNDLVNLFDVHVDPNLGPAGKDTFQITKNDAGLIEIHGNSGVTVAWGLHYYLKNYCNAHISWDGNQIELPRTLPDVRVMIKSNDRFRYYQNVCTLGYSSVWWQWEQWEQHLDWMALNGINLALAFVGQEVIWERVYFKLNLTQDEIDEHFGGPAFLPWSRMGNIRGFGGPLTANWHRKSLRLQHLILERMREFGIIPVLPAFAGHVPRAFARLFPNAKMTKIDSWNKFEDKYCCPYLLDPTDELFQIVGEMFLKMYIKEFGTDHIYNCDTFNENEPGSSELTYLGNISRSIFSVMNKVDHHAIWLMQGWLFVHEFTFWTEPRVQTFLTSVPIGRMIVLDLQSEQFPQYRRLKSYYGQPFIWCMLHNFGGTLGMFGSAEIINKRVFEGRNMAGSTMVGTGLTPEGINQNYVIYELMNEMAYRREPVDLDLWFENYAVRRYGAWNEYTIKAWKNLGKTIYNFNGLQRIRGKYVATRRPSLKLSTWTWYNRQNFFDTWNTFMMARFGRCNSTLYKHDVVDITRQTLQLLIDLSYLEVLDSYNKKDLYALRSWSSNIIAYFNDLEMILASSKDFLLGNWLKAAKSMADNNDLNEMKLYEYNARNQITLWGPNGEIRDYANKQWSGVIVDYFQPRWKIFLDALQDTISKNIKYNITEINERIFREVEEPFTRSNKIYSTEPKGDPIEIAMNILSNWYSPVLMNILRLRTSSRVSSYEFDL
ncbi:PREDICTED: alpha-N-acetylglucosaminidase [Polistes dominula]|uniref:Alpha-N-acetylglucosaminidase n=1 Tax=Polistes dominula TaxID=743375 RepID=A0ABM1IZ34_POLDO|nr:PREDICTED: alpha-N-acetylglucosaminidase [Polistes dominula]